MEFNGTFFATIITFIVFVFLMNKVLYAPILSIMEKRKNFMDSNYKQAEDNNIKFEQLSSEKDEKLLEAKNDARKKYVEVIEEFKNQRNEILLDKQDFENERYKNSQLELENLSNDAKQSLKNNMSDLANDIVEKVIGYKCDSNDFENEVVDKVLWGK